MSAFSPPPLLHVIVAPPPCLRKRSSKHGGNTLAIFHKREGGESPFRWLAWRGPGIPYVFLRPMIHSTLQLCWIRLESFFSPGIKKKPGSLSRSQAHVRAVRERVGRAFLVLSTLFLSSFLLFSPWFQAFRVEGGKRSSPLPPFPSPPREEERKEGRKEMLQRLQHSSTCDEGVATLVCVCTVLMW